MKRAIALATIAALASCARPVGPVTVPSEEIPFRLERRVEPRGSPVAENEFRMFFVRRSRLTQVRRPLRAHPRAADAVVRSLLEGPTRRERDRNIRTMVPPSTRLLDVRVVETIAEVDLSAEFQDPAPSDELVLRVAQVVFTLVALPDVTAVRFAIDGEPVSVITGRGAIVARPVTAPDYATLAPPP